MSLSSKLEKKAKSIRRDILDLAVKHRNSHIASAFSCVEILLTLYEKISPQDRFIMSKGHGCLALYAVLHSKGFNPKIGGHPDIDKAHGVECTTGSLGHGLPIGVGMAFAKKIKKQKGRVFVLIGDGECEEGTIWESLFLIKKLSLLNITVIIDNNGLQALDYIENVMGALELKKKFRAFGFNTSEINGHDFKQLLDSLSRACSDTDLPGVIIADTVKGKGLSFMENKPCWHARFPDKDLLRQAYRELT